jgi:hypothetical protein
MGIGTFLGYLVGRRDAILTVAACPQALWLGLVFVLSAGFAREYDGEDLLHEPWHVVLPLGASLLSSSILFLVSYGIARGRGAGAPGILRAYRSFLTLFWLTAPLAWLYAIPYERFLSPFEAVQTNLLTLAVVSAWRVILMVRVLQVLMGFSLFSAGCIVLAFADVLVLILLQTLPFPLIEIMGGVRLSASEQLLKSTAQNACLWGFCTGPIWLVGFIVAASTTRPRWAPIPTSLAPVRTELWVLAALSIAVWAVALPFTQPEQMARKRVERLFAHGKLEEALAQMSTHGPGDFPPNWNPPPRSVNLIRDIDLVVRLMNALTDQPQALWVRELYVVKLHSPRRLGPLRLLQDSSSGRAAQPPRCRPRTLAGRQRPRPRTGADPAR